MLTELGVQSQPAWHDASNTRFIRAAGLWARLPSLTTDVLGRTTCATRQPKIRQLGHLPGQGSQVCCWSASVLLEWGVRHRDIGADGPCRVCASSDDSLRVVLLQCRAHVQVRRRRRLRTFLDPALGLDWNSLSVRLCAVGGDACLMSRKPAALAPHVEPTFLPPGLAHLQGNTGWDRAVLRHQACFGHDSDGPAQPCSANVEGRRWPSGAHGQRAWNLQPFAAPRCAQAEAGGRRNGGASGMAHDRVRPRSYGAPTAVGTLLCSAGHPIPHWHS